MQSDDPWVFPIARASSSTFWFTAVLIGALLLLPLILLLVPLGTGRIELEVSQTGLRIKGSIYGRTIADPDSSFARKVTGNDMPGLSPVARTNGVGLPNYQGGWFRLKNGDKALLFMTDWTRAVIVPTSEGYTLLASPEDPDGLLSALAARKATPGVFRDTEPLRFPLADPKVQRARCCPTLPLSVLRLCSSAAYSVA